MVNLIMPPNAADDVGFASFIHVVSIFVTLLFLWLRRYGKCFREIALIRKLF